jgi:hypothetical protein
MTIDVLINFSIMVSFYQKRKINKKGFFDKLEKVQTFFKTSEPFNKINLRHQRHLSRVKSG